jgi:putative phosphoribosyl transferase
MPRYRPVPSSPRASPGETYHGLGNLCHRVGPKAPFPRHSCGATIARLRGALVERHVLYDRRTAGALLGIEVAKAGLGDPVVLGLPRGGVPVAAKVAEALHAPLDVIVVRKLGVPGHAELAMGAVGENGAVVLNDDVVRSAHVTDDQMRRVELLERVELDTRLRRVREIRPHESLVGRTAVIVDDGIATGATVRAAIRVARANGARHVAVAAPVAPPDVVELLRSEADTVVCLAEPDPFWAVGNWYRHFEAVSDDEVVALITAAMARDDVAEPPDHPSRP